MSGIIFNGDLTHIILRSFSLPDSLSVTKIFPNLYYPDWSGGSTSRCINDGKAIHILFVVLDDESCRGNVAILRAHSLSALCPVFMATTKLQCAFVTGNEPEYMRTNGIGAYVFEDLKSCCEKHFSWDLISCLESESTAVDSKYSDLYYPDWEGDNDSCRKNSDGLAPAYMTNNPTAWMHETLESCCECDFVSGMNQCRSVLCHGRNETKRMTR